LVRDIGQKFGHKLPLGEMQVKFAFELDILTFFRAIRSFQFYQINNLKKTKKNENGLPTYLPIHFQNCG
jgi:hypothetical protein